MGLTGDLHLLHISTHSFYSSLDEVDTFLRGLFSKITKLLFVIGVTISIFLAVAIAQTFLSCGTHFWWDVIHLKVVRGDGLCVRARHGQTSLPAAPLAELEVGIAGIEVAVGKRGHITWKFWAFRL